MYNDGGYPNGAPVLITASGFTFKCNSLQLAPTAETQNINDNTGVHAGALQFAGPITFQFEVQHPNTNVPELCPASHNNLHGIFVNVPVPDYSSNVSNYVNRTLFILDVSTTKPQRGPWTASGTAQVRVNS